jgi:hypothetical protein
MTSHRIVVTSSSIESLHLLGSSLEQYELESELVEFKLGCEDTSVTNVISRLVTQL